MHKQASLFFLAVFTGAGTVGANQNILHGPTSTSEPDWFRTRPQSYQGPTATGVAPFLAQMNPAPFAHTTYTANYPLETSEPIQGSFGRNAFHKMGYLSPYYPGEESWGVDEYPIPDGSKITQMHLLHRHGSRYPNTNDHLDKWARNIVDAVEHGTKFTGSLSFLNNWSYALGADMLVTRGQQELFDSGVVNFFNYGALYNSTSKIVVRTTTKDRMLKSTEHFLAGFFGSDWSEKANILAMIESSGFNTSLMSKHACQNVPQTYGSYSTTPISKWKNKYLKRKTRRLRKISGGYDWNVTDSYNAQSMCAYETVSLGYSKFCHLFDYEEWIGFSYVSDIWFSSISGFLGPVGRAQGITWVQEFIARVEEQPFDASIPSAANLTLNSNPVTFPTNQSLYMDFSHDKILVSVLAAFGLKQFASFLPPSGPPKHHQFDTSRIIPFAGRINIEIIKAPHEIKSRRSRNLDNDPYIAGTTEVYYVHFLLNQRTVPLHTSLKECAWRDDGWCELSTFLDIQKKNVERAEYSYSCTGDWKLGKYGDVRDGVPPY